MWALSAVNRGYGLWTMVYGLPNRPQGLADYRQLDGGLVLDLILRSRINRNGMETNLSLTLLPKGFIL